MRPSGERRLTESGKFCQLHPFGARATGLLPDRSHNRLANAATSTGRDRPHTPTPRRRGSRNGSQRRRGRPSRVDLALQNASGPRAARKSSAVWHRGSAVLLQRLRDDSALPVPTGNCGFKLQAAVVGGSMQRSRRTPSRSNFALKGSAPVAISREHHAEREQVGPRVRAPLPAPAPATCRRPVPRVGAGLVISSSETRRCFRASPAALRHQLRQTEVQDLRLAPLRDEDVRRLDVPMDDPFSSA